MEVAWLDNITKHKFVLVWWEQKGEGNFECMEHYVARSFVRQLRSRGVKIIVGEPIEDNPHDSAAKRK